MEPTSAPVRMKPFSSIGIPVAHARCDLGTWQGLYLWEHRNAPHQRRITVTVIGERT